MSFGGLFDLSKVDSGVANLFSSSSAGPVTKDQLRSSRTEIKIAKEKRAREEKEKKGDENDEEDSEDGSDSDEEENSDEESDEEEERVVKKPKKNDMRHDDLEARYFNKILKEKDVKEDIKGNDVKDGEKKDGENEIESEDEGEKEGEDEGEVDGEKKDKGKSGEAKTLDLKETEMEKAEKTVFVGNVTSSVITSRQVAKKFKKLFSEFGKVESIRYRSIAFDEALPRKVAFAKKTLHKSRDTVNAYVVFTEKEASLKSQKLNATVFEGFHIRVDHVAHPAPKDNKRTIFVGNLDFEEKEETLWQYFNEKIDNDVESVRVIRDAKTNVGKGFALVQFKDTLSVNRAVLLNDKPMGEKGRKLRISRAKSYAKPSILSPNHIDNSKKAFAAKKALSEQQKTKLGRAQRVLGKADRATVGQTKVIEGQRASKGSRIAGIKGLKGSKVKKPRIRERSSKFKQERDQIKQDFQKGSKNPKDTKEKKPRHPKK